jgi:SAM-dependent methyltransferase
VSHLEPYTSAVARLGVVFDVLQWRTPEEQRARFAEMFDLVDPRGRVIADLGCGRGDLLPWLSDRGLAPAGYIGVDALGLLTEVGRARAEREGLGPAEFIVGDFLTDDRLLLDVVRVHRADILVFSGSLSTYAPDQALGILGRAWEALRIAARRHPRPVLAFNFLNERCAHEHGSLPRGCFVTEEMLAWAMDRARHVELRTGYLDGRDTTIGMVRTG